MNKFNWIQQDGASLTQAMVSKEAKFFRQQFCRFVADILHQWMLETLVRSITTVQYSSSLRVASEPDNRELGPSSRLSTPLYDYRSVLRDRRLKVIFSHILNSTRKNPILMLRLYWTSFVMSVVALAMASHHVIISLSEAYLGPISFASKQYAIPWCSYLTPIEPLLKRKRDVKTSWSNNDWYQWKIWGFVLYNSWVGLRYKGHTKHQPLALTQE